ncbi:hypothetical protein MKX07_002150 [Trichoderma sp. CBMAI-0711]|nr:hypothetical protein MKX07_002150 [Trichoderma sp. CBMAI-0711]
MPLVTTAALITCQRCPRPCSGAVPRDFGTPGGCAQAQATHARTLSSTIPEPRPGPSPSLISNLDLNLHLNHNLTLDLTLNRNLSFGLNPAFTNTISNRAIIPPSRNPPPRDCPPASPRRSDQQPKPRRPRRRLPHLDWARLRPIPRDRLSPARQLLDSRNNMCFL